MSIDVHPAMRIIVPLPTDLDLGAEMADQVKVQGKNLNDIRMVAGTGELAKPIGDLAGAVFRVSGVDAKVRQFIVLRIATLLQCPNLRGPNEQMATNLGATSLEIEALRVSGPLSALDENATLVLTATEEVTVAGTLTDPTLAALL